jgi:mannose-1-phosphate guanylyltransferase
MNATSAGHSDNDWVLVLAGGEGSRLRQLTTRDGLAVPKQYCSLTGGQTLLDDTIARSTCVVRRDRICVIVAAQHRQWWQPLLQDLPAQNVIVQPRNKGTGIGLMYATLHIAAMDPDARIVALPADHYVRDEDTLCGSLRAALVAVQQHSQQIVLLGVQPDHADCELGYVVPSVIGPSGLYQVQRFVEKPDGASAEGLIQKGALWNTFILAATARTVMDLFVPRYAFASFEMQMLVERSLSGAGNWAEMVSFYERLPNVDFSHDVLAARQHELQLLQVPACGWSDLGTPHRVAQTLQSLSTDTLSRAERAPFMNLASQQAWFAGVSSQASGLNFSAKRKGL